MEDVGDAQVQLEKEQREASSNPPVASDVWVYSDRLLVTLGEATLVMRLSGRTRPSVQRTFEKTVYDLSPDVAVLQFETNLRNFRDYKASDDSIENKGKKQLQASVLSKLTAESEITAAILDALSASLMQLDPPKVVMSTLRAAEAALIRNRISHSDDRSKGLRSAVKSAAKMKIHALGREGHAQNMWRDTFVSTRAICHCLWLMGCGVVKLQHALRCMLQTHAGLF